MADFPTVEGGCRHRLRSFGPYGPTWPCNRPRWHGGRHRFRNYTWPRVPQVWRVAGLWRTWKANSRLRGMGTGRDGLMRSQSVLYPKRFDPVPVGEGDPR